MTRRYDAVVIGAGPAGLSAGACLGEMGLNVMVLDEQDRPGGQLFCNIEAAAGSGSRLFGEDFETGAALVKRFANSRAGYENSASVWQADPDGTVFYSRSGRSRKICGNYVIMATGAMERPVPFPGWQLAGVMGAGAVNRMAKLASLLPSGPVVLAGSGPLLLWEAARLYRKGIDITALLDTAPVFPPAPAFAHIPNALRRMDFLWKGLSLLRELQSGRIPWYRGVTGLRATGTNRLKAVEARCKTAALHLKTDMLFVHFGVIPNTHIFRQAGCRMAWKSDQRYWYPECDQWGRTNFEKIFAAGDGAIVSGGVAAIYKGALSALEVARCLGMISEHERDTRAVSINKEIASDQFPRPFVDALYAHRPGCFSFEDDTVLCRCEHITVGDVRKAVSEGGRDLDEIKVMTRVGMGPCQGRMCGPALAEMVASDLSMPCEKLSLLNIRPPLKPVPLQEIADLELTN